MLRVKLTKLDMETQHRRMLADIYLQNIHDGTIRLPQIPDANEHVWHLFVVRTRQRLALQQHLASRGIQTLIHYPIPPHKQRAYQEWNGRSLPITETMHQEVLSLPIGPTMTKEDAQQITAAVNGFCTV